MAVRAQYVLDPLKLDDFDTTKRQGYRLSVHEVLGVDMILVAIIQALVQCNAAFRDVHQWLLILCVYGLSTLSG